MERDTQPRRAGPTLQLGELLAQGHGFLAGAEELLAELAIAFLFGLPFGFPSAAFGSQRLPICC